MSQHNKIMAELKMVFEMDKILDQTFKSRRVINELDLNFKILQMIETKPSISKGKRKPSTSVLTTYVACGFIL